MLRHVDFDPLFRKTTEYHYAPDGGITVVTKHDVGDLLEHNKANHAAVDERARWGGDGDSLGRRVASIPDHIYARLYLDGIAQDEKAFRRWLNDKSNSLWRTRPGKV